MLQPIVTVDQQNTLQNQSYTAGLSQNIISAIKHAAKQTGVDFSYLLKKAAQESGLNPTATASSSSATGLYQFTQQTWLKMVKDYGSQYGLGPYADHIDIGSNGVAHVSDATWRKNILNLRNDPESSAEMAGALDRVNQTALQDNVGGKIGGTELYLAHFLGAGGASTFLNDMKSSPKASAASVLPEAAAANPNVFYNKDGSARTLSQVYNHFAAKFDDHSSSSTLVASVATATAPVSTTPGAATPSVSQHASSVAVASLSASFGASTGTSYASAAASLNGLKSEGSSLFATMVLAQMNDESKTLSSTGGDTGSSTYERSSSKSIADLMDVTTS